MRTTTGTERRIAVGTPARPLAFALLLMGLLLAVGLAVVASGILKPPVVPATELSALTWRQPVAAGGFAPLASAARDPQGRIWVVDAAAGRFAIYQPDGTFIENWQPSDGPTFNLIRENGDAYGEIAFGADGSRFVLDVGNHRVLAYDASGAFVTTWGTEGEGPGQLSDPVGIAVRPDGNVAVLDDVRGVIETYSRDGTVIGSFDAFIAPPAGADDSSNGFTIDAAGNMYVTQIIPDRSGLMAGRVQKFSPAGEALLLFGVSDPGRFTEQPTKVAIDAAGNVYVTQGPMRGDRPGVLIFDRNGTYLGGFGPLGSGEGQLGFPTGILVDGQGNLVVVDSGLPVGNALTNPSIQGYRITLPTSP